MLTASLTLRFNGSFRVGCGGAGAVLLSAPTGEVCWHGLEFDATLGFPGEGPGLEKVPPRGRGDG